VWLGVGGFLIVGVEGWCVLFWVCLVVLFGFGLWGLGWGWGVVGGGVWV
jgi:hypothetical protein